MTSLPRCPVWIIQTAQRFTCFVSARSIKRQTQSKRNQTRSAAIFFFNIKVNFLKIIKCRSGVRDLRHDESPDAYRFTLHWIDRPGRSLRSSRDLWLVCRRTNAANKSRRAQPEPRQTTSNLEPRVILLFTYEITRPPGGCRAKWHVSRNSEKPTRNEKKKKTGGCLFNF